MRKVGLSHHVGRLLPLLLGLALGLASAADFEAWLPNNSGVDLVEVITHELSGAERLHALVTGNASSGSSHVQSEFVSVVREGPEGRQVIAEFVLEPTFLVSHLRWEDGNADGSPEFVWVSLLDGWTRGAVTVGVVDVFRGQLFEASWDYPLRSEHPKPVVTLDPERMPESMFAYVDAFAGALTDSEHAAEVMSFALPDGRGEARAPFRMEIRDVRIDPTDLCRGYAVDLLEYWPVDSSLRGFCDLEEFTSKLEELARPVREELNLRSNPENLNVVRGATLAQELQEELLGLERIEEAREHFPPWQRRDLQDWVYTDTLLALEPAVPAVEYFLVSRSDDRWAGDVLRSRQLCRVAEAPEWCSSARAFGFLD